MEFRISSKLMLKILYIISFIIFIGLCIEAGSFISNGIFTMAKSSDNAAYFGLSNLYAFDPGYYIVIIILMTIAGVLKAIMFYLIVKILHDKKLQMVQPFNIDMGRFIFNVSYHAVGIGVFSFWGVKYIEWLVKQGVQMPDVQTLNFGGADVWLFMGVVLLVIAHIFKRGIEIQTENDLTI
ncbi:MAG: DUF2975 domain-containing protein [Chitinophagaceae bacterium]